MKIEIKQVLKIHIAIKLELIFIYTTFHVTDFKFLALDSTRMSSNLRKVLRVGLIRINKTYYLVAIVPVLDLEKYPMFKITSIPKLNPASFATTLQIDDGVLITN